MLISSVWRGRSAWAFGLGLIAGGATIGLLAAAVGALSLQWWVSTAVRVVAVLLVLVAALLHMAGLMRLPLPQNARQVPEAVARTGPLLGALQFGFEMGTGMRTFMTSALPHVVLTTVLLLGGTWEAVAAGLGFGLGRAIVPIARWAAGDEWSDGFDRSSKVTGLGLATAVVVAVSAIVATAI